MRDAKHRALEPWTERASVRECRPTESTARHGLARTRWWSYRGGHHRHRSSTPDPLNRHPCWRAEVVGLGRTISDLLFHRFSGTGLGNSSVTSLRLLVKSNGSLLSTRRLTRAQGAIGAHARSRTASLRNRLTRVRGAYEAHAWRRYRRWIDRGRGNRCSSCRKRSELPGRSLLVLDQESPLPLWKFMQSDEGKSVSNLMS